MRQLATNQDPDTQPVRGSHDHKKFRFEVENIVSIFKKKRKPLFGKCPDCGEPNSSGLGTADGKPEFVTWSCGRKVIRDEIVPCVPISTQMRFWKIMVIVLHIFLITCLLFIWLRCMQQEQWLGFTFLALAILFGVVGTNNIRSAFARRPPF